MAATRAQAAVANGLNGGETQISAAFGSNVTIGNTIFARAHVAAGITLTSGMMTDDLGNVYTLLKQLPSQTFADIGVWMAPVTVAGACTVTFNDGNAARHGIVVDELVGSFSFTDFGEGVSWEFEEDIVGSAAFDTGTITVPDNSGICIGVQYNNGGDPDWEADYETGSAGSDTGRFWSAIDLDVPAGANNATGTFGGSCLHTTFILWVSGAAPQGDPHFNARPMTMRPRPFAPGFGR